MTPLVAKASIQETTSSLAEILNCWESLIVDRSKEAPSERAILRKESSVSSSPRAKQHVEIDLVPLLRRVQDLRLVKHELHPKVQHQVLAFNPDECSCNGGPMTPGRCMDYARDYVALRYPDQEVVSVLRLEERHGDGSRRFACHLGVNRSDLATGLRLDEGAARRAAAARAATVRALDERYGLRQLERGRANSHAHARQSSRAEREMARRGRAGGSENARAAVARRVEEVGRMRSCPDRMAELERRLTRDGVRMRRGARGGLQYEFRSRSLGGTRRVSGARLGFARDRRTGVVVRFTARGIREGLEAFRALERVAERQYEQEDGRS